MHPPRKTRPRGLPAKEVHLWLIDLTQAGEFLPAWERLLSRPEVQQARSYRFERDRLLFAARRAVLRLLLSGYTRLRPEAIDYRLNSHGRPELVSGALQFNLSHSQERVAIGLTRRHPIGIDLEQVNPAVEPLRLAERYFSDDERAGLQGLPATQQAEGFFHVWTQKEAFVKATGEGLSRSLQDFSVAVDPGRPGGLLSLRDGEQASAWVISAHVPAPGWRLAICLRASPPAVLRWYEPNLAEISAWSLGGDPPWSRAYAHAGRVPAGPGVTKKTQD